MVSESTDEGNSGAAGDSEWRGREERKYSFDEAAYVGGA
jgi:hypothetical protein